MSAISVRVALALALVIERPGEGAAEPPLTAAEGGAELDRVIKGLATQLFVAAWSGTNK